MTQVKLAAERMFAIGMLLMVVTAVAIGLPGCGVKSAPIPPEYASPERILDLRAESDVPPIMSAAIRCMTSALSSSNAPTATVR
jgi:hypothetical protein